MHISKFENRSLMWLIASERRHARNVSNTTQADRRSVVTEECGRDEHLGEMRRTSVIQSRP